LVACEARARSAIELGACAGLSGYYLGAAPTMERLITIEGSAALAEVARNTLAPLGGRAQVIAALFNDALDDLLPGCAPIDLAYIDGHHEKIATLTYFERLKPVLSDGAILLFDDISWSQDMRDGWDQICAMPRLSHCIDLGVVGLCIWDPTATRAKVWDLRQMVGATGVGKPHGWDKQAGEMVD
jgi:predicted O-methyltransferase YrrM